MWKKRYNKKDLMEKVKNNDFTDDERNRYRLYRFCDYSWIKLDLNNL